MDELELPENLCPKCRANPEGQPHECPFDCELNPDEAERLCRCCRACTHECAMNV